MEEWKDINGYKGYYQISNIGNVRSLRRSASMKNGVRRTYQGRVLKPALDGRKRYLQVNLSKNAVSKMHQVHRLVGKSFVDGYFDGGEIDHIDTNTTNNNASNLKWTTRSGNMLNPITHNKTIIDHIENQRIPVIGVNELTGHVLHFNYVREAKKNGYKGIGENIHGRTKHCGGYVWRYANEV